MKVVPNDNIIFTVNNSSCSNLEVVLGHSNFNSPDFTGHTLSQQYTHTVVRSAKRRQKLPASILLYLLRSNYPLKATKSD